jgi:hypothetical protein
MRTTYRHVSLVLSVAAGAVLASGSAEARPKKYKQMNSCTCVCRQESETEVYLSNKDFYSVAGCLSYNSTACDVTVSTSEGTHQVTGTWEGCVDHGKVWVRVRAAASRDLPKLTVDPGAVQEPPKPPSGVANPDGAVSAEPGGDEKPPKDYPRSLDGAADQSLERSPE